MRTQVFVYDAFNRDTSWITQEMIEDFAGAMLRGPASGSACLMKWARGNAEAQQLANELLWDNPDIRLLQDDLIEEFGEEYFIGKPKSKEYHIRQLEARIAIETDGKVVAALVKELRELREWTVKPAEKGLEANVSVNIGNGSGQVVFDRNNPREAERIVMSVFGSI